MNQWFGATLKRARKELKLSQDALAKQLGIPTGTVSAWEQDTYRPNLDVFVLLLANLRPYESIVIDGMHRAALHVSDALEQGSNIPVAGLTPEKVGVMVSAAKNSRQVAGESQPSGIKRQARRKLPGR
jgi:DNA-binding XRE family transcriptional regulator